MHKTHTLFDATLFSAAAWDAVEAPVARATRCATR